jgi:nucleoside-diphosphate-sugar epimerase
MLRTALAQKETAVELNQVKKHLFSAPAERQEKSGKVLITRGSGFMYVDDSITGTRRISNSNETEPINLGSDQPMDLVEAIAEVKLRRHSYSDNTLIVEGLGWAPEISLEVGLEQTYWWI